MTTFQDLAAAQAGRAQTPSATFRPHPSFPGLEISNCGTVRSVRDLPVRAGSVTYQRDGVRRTATVESLHRAAWPELYPRLAGAAPAAPPSAPAVLPVAPVVQPPSAPAPALAPKRGVFSGLPQSKADPRYLDHCRSLGVKPELPYVPPPSNRRLTAADLSRSIREAQAAPDAPEEGS